MLIFIFSDTFMMICDDYIIIITFKSLNLICIQIYLKLYILVLQFIVHASYSSSCGTKPNAVSDTGVVNDESSCILIIISSHTMQGEEY